MTGPQGQKATLKPPALKTGDAISIVALASPALQERIDGGMERLSSLGFVPRSGKNTYARGPIYFAGTSEQRLADLHAAFADPDTRAVMALRGGYGSNYLLAGLNLEGMRQNPKPFFAYSDHAGIQLHLLDQLGLPAFHGPMAAADFYLEDGVHLPSFEAAISGEPYSVGNAEGLVAIKPGTVRGTLYGGCLSILVSLIGTPWEPHTEGTVLFLEDVGAKPYQIDRMLWQLRHSHKLDGVRGIVFGEMLDCVSPGAAPDLLLDVIRNVFQDFDGPIAFGLRSGHVSRQNVTLTFGVEAELKVDEEAQLHLLEPAVAR